MYIYFRKIIKIKKGFNYLFYLYMCTCGVIQNKYLYKKSLRASFDAPTGYTLPIDRLNVYFDVHMYGYVYSFANTLGIYITRKKR